MRKVLVDRAAEAFPIELLGTGYVFDADHDRGCLHRHGGSFLSCIEHYSPYVEAKPQSVTGPPVWIEDRTLSRDSTAAKFRHIGLSGCRWGSSSRDSVGQPVWMVDHGVVSGSFFANGQLYSTWSNGTFTR